MAIIIHYDNKFVFQCRLTATYTGGGRIGADGSLGFSVVYNNEINEYEQDSWCEHDTPDVQWCGIYGILPD